MRKGKIMASVLTAASIMTLTAPAFADTGDENGKTDVGITIEADEYESSSDQMDFLFDEEGDDGFDTDFYEDVPETDCENSETTSTETSAVADNDTENTLHEIKNADNTDSADTAAVSTEAVKIYTNKSGQTVYEAQNAKAIVNADGHSGTIIFVPEKYISTTYTGVTIKEKYTCDNVGNIPLKDIIHFGDGGYVTSVEGQIGNAYKIFGYGNNTFTVYASGPKAFFSMGHLEFTDQTGDTYSLNIWLHKEDKHFIRYESNSPKIIAMSWY